MSADLHQDAWRTWSASQCSRLLALPRTELLLAVQTGALDNLIAEDAKTILASLAGFKSVLPTIREENGTIKTMRATGRRPAPLTGGGLPIGPKITVLMRLKRDAGLVALASAVLIWTLVLGGGDLWLLNHSTIG